MSKFELNLKQLKMSKVNLDALIPRADFIALGDTGQRQSNLKSLSLQQLLKNEYSYLSLYHLLKKPDFQRETNEWDKKRILQLIECFIDGSFIPSVILWENNETGQIFVIDGAHRLSAIIAYINDDYGDKGISNDFYKYTGIQQAEQDLAQETRDYINNKIGSFEKIMTEGGERSDGLKQGEFDVQLIKGDVKKAEESFFKINQQGVVISPTEKELCKGREFPICISTRSIIKGVSGHQYWARFDNSLITPVSDISSELNRSLFYPPFVEDVKSLVMHQPLGGSITNAMPMVFTMMKIIKEKYRYGKEEKKDFTNGSETLKYLEWTRKLVGKTLSERPGSLGLHPSIYFYSNVNKYIHSSFLGMMQLLLEKEDNPSFLPNFTKVRANLEAFLNEYKVFLGQINKKYGSDKKSYRHMKGFYNNLIDYLVEEYPKKIEEIKEAVLKKIKEKYTFLNERETEIEDAKGSGFSKDTKHLRTYKDEIAATVKCSLCGGFIHPMSKSYDHKNDLKHGGSSGVEDAQATHFYCNNSKDKLIEMGIFKIN